MENLYHQKEREEVKSIWTTKRNWSCQKIGSNWRIVTCSKLCTLTFFGTRERRGGKRRGGNDQGGGARQLSLWKERISFRVHIGDNRGFKISWTTGICELGDLVADSWFPSQNLSLLSDRHEIYRLFREITITVAEDQMREYVPLPMTFPRTSRLCWSLIIHFLSRIPYSPGCVAEINEPLRQVIETCHDSPDIVYVLLLVRLQFLKEKALALSNSTLCETRANYCEYFAGHMLRYQGKSFKGRLSQLAMARALVGGLHAFQGASEEVKVSLNLFLFHTC